MPVDYWVEEPKKTNENIIEMIHKFEVEVVEEQEKLLMRTIQRIGGTEYSHITIDKNKVVEAFAKQIPKKPIADPANLCDFQNFHCPECNQKIIARLDGEWIAGKLQNYCDKCGQALDWSGDNGKE